MTAAVPHTWKAIVPARALVIIQIIDVLIGNINALGAGNAAPVLTGDPEVAAIFAGRAGNAT
jgi:hypothetical protein